MSSKEEILANCRKNIHKTFERPSLDDIGAITFPDTYQTFKEEAAAMGSRIIEAKPGEKISEIVKRLFPDAKEIAGDPAVCETVTRDPDKIESAQALNGTDVGIIKGDFGVAENGCVWVRQTMKEKAVCFISENLVILLPAGAVVNNMHEAYKKVTIDPEYGYGSFLCGPSKTADIAQVLVTGAQAARSLTLILMP